MIIMLFTLNVSKLFWLLTFLRIFTKSSVLFLKALSNCLCNIEVLCNSSSSLTVCGCWYTACDPLLWVILPTKFFKGYFCLKFFTFRTSWILLFLCPFWCMISLSSLFLYISSLISLSQRLFWWLMLVEFSELTSSFSKYSRILCCLPIVTYKVCWYYFMFCL